MEPEYDCFSWIILLIIILIWLIKAMLGQTKELKLQHTNYKTLKKRNCVGVMRAKSPPNPTCHSCSQPHRTATVPIFGDLLKPLSDLLMNKYMSTLVPVTRTASLLAHIRIRFK